MSFSLTLTVAPSGNDKTWTVINTLDTNDLTIRKNTTDNKKGTFDFEAHFWIEHSTKDRYPVKVGHSQLFPRNTGGNTVYEGEFVFEDGVTIGGQDVAGVYELEYIDAEGEYVVTGQPLNPGGKIPDYLDLKAIMGSLRPGTGGLEVGGRDTTFTRYHETNRKLNDFGLAWHGVTDETVYVVQEKEVVEEMFEKGRRMDWYIIPTPAPGQEINIRVPYSLRTEDNTDGKQQLPEGADGEDGTYYFTLKNGGHITFANLPYGVSYDVYEVQQSGWGEVTGEDCRGTLIEDKTFTFENSIKKGRLIISKATENNEKGRFTFRALFGRPIDLSTVSGTTAKVVYPADGSARTVEADGKEIESGVWEFTAAGKTYVVHGHGVEVGGSYADDMNVDYPYEFTLKENHDGRDYAMHYRFEPVKDEDSGAVLKYMLTITSATYEFSLSNGGKAIFSSLPVGTDYEVEETDIPQGWELVSLTNDPDGDLKAAGTMNVGSVRDSEAAAATLSYTFTNSGSDTETTDEYMTITRYITYTEYTVNGKKVADTVKQPIKIKRTKTENKRTGKVTYTKWIIIEGSAGAVTSPDYPGWKPDQYSVGEWNFNQDDPQDEWVHVIYVPAKGNGTNTGDSGNMIPWIGLMAAAFIGFGALLMLRRRRRKG